MAAILYWCVNRHLPALQQKIANNAQAAVASTDVGGIDVAVSGRAATLTGTVQSEQERERVFDVVRKAGGIRQVQNNLMLVGQADAGSDNDKQSNIVVESAIPQAIAPNDEQPQEAQEQQATEVDTPPSSPVAADTGDTSSSADTITTDSANADATTVVPIDVPTDMPTEANNASSKTNNDELAIVGDIEQPESNDSSEPQTLTEASAETREANENIVEPENQQNNTDTAANAEAQLDSDAELPQNPPTSDDTQIPLPSAADTGGSVEAKANELIRRALQKQKSGNTLIDTETPQNAYTKEGNNGIPRPADSPQPTVVNRNPTFQLQVDGKTLNLSGNISNKDNLLDFIQIAMTEFDANYVVNSVQVNADTAEAAWLPSLTGFLPQMKTLSAAGIDVIESQVTLSGVAANAAQHDTVINAALNELTALSLVERITINPDETAMVTTKPSTGTSPLASSAGTTNATLSNSENADLLATEFATLGDVRILFESGSDVLTQESRAVVESIAGIFSQYPDISIEIDGHTDSSGSAAVNLKLSQLRANAVRDYLVELGIDADRLKAYGFGDGVPIADNSTAAGRRLNRRIEFNY